ncbi:hypothetical protein, partial [Escherichia coli]|uniref:hypothetical protein n=1 Tax=Escherichia coli TaxID=562 RepID=UPI001BC8A1ED
RKIDEFIDVSYKKGPPVGSPVDGQNSWELGGVKMGVFESYFGKSDKIDGNWVWCCKLARKLKMTK